MRTLLVPFALVLALAGASAEGCTPTTTRATFTVHAYGGIGYYAYDACLDDSPRAQEECMYWGAWAVWIYQESNGIAGLQRDDEMRDDTCGGMIQGDTVIF